jgi:hypothetical protein
MAEILLEGGAKKVTKFFSPHEVVKATLQGRRDKRTHQQTILFTFGRPNYEERRFIKLAQRAREPFPIKKYQLKWDKKS